MRVCFEVHSDNELKKELYLEMDSEQVRSLLSIKKLISPFKENGEEKKFYSIQGTVFDLSCSPYTFRVELMESV